MTSVRMANTYDQLSVGVETGYPTYPLRPSASDVAGYSLSGFAGAGSSSTTFEPTSPYTLPSSNGFYDSGADSSLTPAVSSVCISVSKKSFPLGHTGSGYLFPKGTVVTLLKRAVQQRTSRIRSSAEAVYDAKLGFSDNAFNIGDSRWNLKRDQFPKVDRGSTPASYQNNLRFIQKFVEEIRDKKKDTYKEANKECSYVIGNYDDYVHKDYITGSNGDEKQESFCQFATERLVPIGVLAEATFLEPEKAKVVSVAVKGVAEVALAADFSDQKRVLPKPGQQLFLTVDGAIDQGQRACMQMLLKSQENCAWINALRIKVVVAPTARDKTVLALLA